MILEEAMKLQITDVKIRRFVAFWIDEIILGTPMVMLFPSPPLSESTAFWETIVRSSVWWFPLLLRDMFGRSLGKFIMGLEIINLESGGKPSIKQCFLRNLTFLLSFYEGIVLLFTEDDRRWGDKLAKTRVILKSK